MTSSLSSSQSSQHGSEKSSRRRESGFAFLPFLWLVNIVWFFREAFIKQPFPGQSKIKSDVIMCGIGFLVWFGALTAWIITYQNHRAEWGEIGDRISFVIPQGVP